MKDEDRRKKYCLAYRICSAGVIHGWIDLVAAFEPPAR